MKKQLTIIMASVAAFLFMHSTFAQSEIDTTVSLDLLAIPNSPAFQLLGISPTNVDRPNTPADFAFSVANATENASIIPKNYAIEFLPVSFFKNSAKSYEKFTNSKNSDGVELTNGKKLLNNISQTFCISNGFSTNDGVSTDYPDYIKTRSGIGFKVSLVRGKIDKDFEDYKTSIEKIRKTLSKIHDANNNWIDSVRNNDVVYVLLSDKLNALANQIKDINNSNLLSDSEKEFKKDSLKKLLPPLTKSIEARTEEIKNTRVLSEVAGAAEMKKQIEQIKFKRYGFMLDLAGGTVLGFRNDDFLNSVVEQYAFWLNGGYSLKKGFCFLALARITSMIDATYDEQGQKTDLSMYDFGGKIEYHTNDDKFMLSAEGVIRMTKDDNVNHYSFNAGYQVGKNQALTFSVGKGFTGTAEVGGNLIAALNYIKSFGSTRAVVPGGN